MSRWQKELEKVRASHRGRLHPKHVVEAARDPHSPLHGKFEWDNTTAAEAYRLQQAAELIRVVTFMPSGAKEPIRAYVSLSSDRLSQQGYRAMVDVLSDAHLKAQLLADAQAELESFRMRFDRLRKVMQMKRLFREVDRVVDQPRA